MATPTLQILSSVCVRALRQQSPRRAKKRKTTQPQKHKKQNLVEEFVGEKRYYIVYSGISIHLDCSGPENLGEDQKSDSLFPSNGLALFPRTGKSIILAQKQTSNVWRTI